MLLSLSVQKREYAYSVIDATISGLPNFTRRNKYICWFAEHVRQLRLLVFLFTVNLLGLSVPMGIIQLEFSS